VLQCVAVRFSVIHTNVYGHLRCVAVCCSVLQCDAVCCSVVQYCASCCSMLQCVAACCSVLQCVAVCCSVSCTHMLSHMKRTSLQQHSVLHIQFSAIVIVYTILQREKTLDARCNMLPHTQVHCTHCNTLQKQAIAHRLRSCLDAVFRPHIPSFVTFNTDLFH